MAKVLTTCFVAWGLVVVVLASEPEGDEAERCWASAAAAGAAAGASEDAPECLVKAATALAPRVLDGLRAEEIARLGRALAAAVLDRADVSATVRRAGRDEQLDRYAVTVSGVEHELLLLRDGAAWTDVLWDGASLIEHYRERAERLVSRYSFEYLLGELTGRGVVVLDDFENEEEGAPPRNWSRRTFGDDDGRNPYAVVRESPTNLFLRAEVEDENVMLYKEVRWNARKYPYLAWRWRVRHVPEGSDERVEAKADSAAGLYLSYRRKLGLVPETVKFVWSARHPLGTRFRRPGIGMPWTVVAGSGRADSVWHEVVFHTRDVYEETFEGDPGERPIGIGLLSDANNTGGYAAADYDDIVALAEPPLRGAR